MFPPLRGTRAKRAGVPSFGAGWAASSGPPSPGGVGAAAAEFCHSGGKHLVFGKAVELFSIGILCGEGDFSPFSPLTE